MQKPPLSVRIIYQLTRIIYLLSILFSLATVFVALSLSTDIFNNGLNMSIKLPIISDVEQIGIANFYGHEMDISYADAVGKVDFENAPKIVARIFSALILLTAIVTFYIVHLFFRFVKNVKMGVVFEINNVKILRKLGFTLLGFYFFIMVGSVLWKYGFNTGEFFSSIKFSVDGFYLTLLLSALFVIMLSQMFISGLELKEENKLTI